MDDGGEAESSRAEQVRKSSTSSERSVTSLHSHSSGSAAADDEDDTAAREGSDETDEPVAAGTAASGLSGPRFMLSTANTMTASFTLSQEQIAYLISVNHPNIQQHFFASFLTRDHALQLLDGILKQKHGRDGFTSLSSPSPLPTPAVSSTNSPASQTRSISRDNTAGAEKDNKGKTKKALPTAQPVASSVADTATATTTATGTTADDQYSMLLPASASQELPTSLSFSTPSHHSTVVHSQLPSSQSVDSVSTFHQSSRASATAADSPSTAVPHSPAAVDDASQTDGGDEWASADEAPASIADTLDFGTADMQPPLGDFNDADDALLLDTTFALDPLLFFHLFYADLAPFSLHSYHAQRATDSEFKMTRWRDIVEEPSMAAAAASQSEAKRREVEGDLLRRLSYRMQFVTPVGPPITRVHRVQRWYVLNKQQQQPSGARLDSCSVTPDIMFGDQVVILERMYVEQLPSEQSTATAEGTDGEQQQQPQVRVRVFGGVRFKSRPWKMKPFIGLIQQRSREDVKAGVEQWEQFVKRKMLEEPEKVEACKKRVAALRVRSGVEQLIPKGQPNHSWKRATTLPVGPRTQSSQPSASHEASTSTSTSASSARSLLSNNRHTAQPSLTSLSAITGVSPTPSVAASAQSVVLPTPANRSLSALSMASPRSMIASTSGAAGFGGRAPSQPTPPAYWLSVRPTVRRLLPSASSSLVIERMDAVSVALSQMDRQQRAALAFFSVALLVALLLGPTNRLFAVSFLLFVGLVSVSAFCRLHGLSAALDEEQQQLHTVQQLLMAVKLEQERSGAEQKESSTKGKRPVSNVLIDPTHFK